MKLLIPALALALFAWLANYSLQNHAIPVESSMNDAMDKAIAESEATREVILIPNQQMIDSMRIIDAWSGDDYIKNPEGVKYSERGALMDDGKIPARSKKSHNFD